MKWLGILSAILTLVAVFVGVSSLTAFGFDLQGIVVILVPMAVAVTLFFTLVTYIGVWSARWLNRGASEERNEAPEKEEVTEV